MTDYFKVLAACIMTAVIIFGLDYLAEFGPNPFEKIEKWNNKRRRRNKQE